MFALTSLSLSRTASIAVSASKADGGGGKSGGVGGCQRQVWSISYQYNIDPAFSVFCACLVFLLPSALRRQLTRDLCSSFSWFCWAVCFSACVLASNSNIANRSKHLFCKAKRSTGKNNFIKKKHWKNNFIKKKSTYCKSNFVIFMEIWKTS